MLTSPPVKPEFSFDFDNPEMPQQAPSENSLTLVLPRRRPVQQIYFDDSPAHDLGTTYRRGRGHTASMRTLRLLAHAAYNIAESTGHASSTRRWQV